MSKRVIQNHHINYEAPWVVKIFKGEHEILTRLFWYSKKTVSQGLIIALRDFINKNETRAINLEEGNGN